MKTLTLLMITLISTSLFIASCGKQNDVVPMEQAVSASENSTDPKHGVPTYDFNQTSADPISNYPDSFVDKTTINYRVEKASSISIEITNDKWQTVESYATVYAEPGEYSIVFDASRLPSGVYHALLTIGNKQYRERMVKLDEINVNLTSGL